MDTSNRQAMLEALIRLLRGVETFLDRLGWHRLYIPPSASKAVYSAGLSEAQLASFQKNQGVTNHCGAYSVAAAISQLQQPAKPRRRRKAAPEGESAAVPVVAAQSLPSRLDYDEVVSIANQHAVFGQQPLEGLARYFAGRTFRVWPDGPTMPRQQAALAEWLGEQAGTPVIARAMRGTPDDLVRFLGMPETKVLVTMGWGKEHRPRIFGPDGKPRTFSPPDHTTLGTLTIDFPFNAHVMLLAAHDPAHTVQDGKREVSAPWGFVNSWSDGGDHLYWMTEDDFRAAWRYVIPGVGRQKLVVIKQKA